MIDFPNSPTDGQQFTSGNISWVWNAATSQWCTALTPNAILDNTVTPSKLSAGAPSWNSNGLLTLAQGQIKFPATQSASSDANTLDDYEEGTFTPTVNIIGGSVSYTQQVGRYIKIGKLVQFWVYLTFTGTNGATLSDLANMPFTVNTTTYYPTIAVGNFYNIYLQANGTVLGVYPQPGTNTMRFHSNGNNTGQMSPTLTTGDMNIRIEGAYEATA